MDAVARLLDAKIRGYCSVGGAGAGGRHPVLGAEALTFSDLEA